MEQRNSLSSRSQVLELEDSRRNRCVGGQVDRRKGNVDREFGSVLSEGRMSRRGSSRVASLWIEREVNYEFVEPHGRALTLAVFLEEDDAQLGEPTEFLVDVLHVSVNNPCGLVNARWFFPAGGLDEIEDMRRQRPHEVIVAGERERRCGIHRIAPFKRLYSIGDVVVELIGRLYCHDEG
jgi:hypothetical protein